MLESRSAAQVPADDRAEQHRRDQADGDAGELLTIRQATGELLDKSVREVHKLRPIIELKIPPPPRPRGVLIYRRTR